MSSFFQIWNLISYSVQLILASSIIIFFSQKKSHCAVVFGRIKAICYAVNYGIARLSGQTCVI